MTLAPSIPFSVTASITVTSTPHVFAMSILSGLTFPFSSTFTGTVTTFPAFSTVTVHSVGPAIFGTSNSPLGPVVTLHLFPSASTIFTVAPFTG